MSSRNPISTVTLLPVAARRWEFFVEHILGSKQSLFWTRPLRIRKEFKLVFKQAFDNEFWNRSASNCFRGAQNRAHRALLATACWLWYKELSLAPVQVKSFPRYGLGLCAKGELVLQSKGNQSTIPSLTGQLVHVKSKKFEKLSAAGYRSLLSGNGRQGVLIGPVSLLNHSCKESQLFLSSSYTVQLKCLSRVRRKFRDGKQILINYGFCLGKSCVRCNKQNS
jgi:hypothetical protein